MLEHCRSTWILGKPQRVKIQKLQQLTLAFELDRGALPTSLRRVVLESATLQMTDGCCSFVGISALVTRLVERFATGSLICETYIPEAMYEGLYNEHVGSDVTTIS